MTDIANPFPYFPEAGTGGFIYVGTAGMDARTNQITVYRDRALTVPWSQPIRTSNGYPVYQGSQTGIYIPSGNVSLTVQNSQNHTVVNVLSAKTLDASLIGSIVPSVSATRCNLQKYDSTDPIVDTNFYIVSGSYEVAS